MWGCRGDKTPGPNDYTFLFIKYFLFFLKEDFILFFNYFYSDNVISKAITSSFLTLIPKSNNSLSLDDYRPICLVDCMYKVLAKLLAGRLKYVPDRIISPCQNAIVPERQLLDGVLVVNEVVDIMLERKEKIVCFLKWILRNLMIKLLAVYDEEDGVQDKMDGMDGVVSF